MVKILRVIFSPKRKSPTKCKDTEYFVNTDNYDIAHSKARAQLVKDIDSELLKYYERVAICDINLI